MKWSEFKKEVEDRLKELGVKDGELAYIDMNGLDRSLDIDFADDGEIYIQGVT